MAITAEFRGAAAVKWYRSLNGRWFFKFAFAPEGGHIAIYCLSRPSLRGQDPDPHKTHVFSTGKLCFTAGCEPREQQRAEELARQWAEYILGYRRTGIAQH